MDKTLDLEISRLLDASRAKVWQAWADPALLAQWWCPKPWTTQVRAFEFHAGGAFHTYMQGPDGGESDNPGCFLEVDPQNRIVFTTMLRGGFQPAAPLLGLTAICTFADEGRGTRYTARALHRDAADCKSHEEMGFHQGWGIGIAQLEDVARGL